MIYIQKNEINHYKENIINITNNYIIDENYASNKLINYITPNTSIIYIGENIEIDKYILKLQNNKQLDKIIILGNIKNKYNSKNLFIFSKISISIMKYIKNNILIIIQPNNNYIHVKNTIKNLIILKKLFDKHNIKIGVPLKQNVLLGFINGKNTIYHNDLINSLKALFIDDIKQQYEYIYDTVCNYLDFKFKQNNFCDFKNDKCIANRLNISAHPNMGCCYSFVYAGFFDIQLIKNIRICQHLDFKNCKAKCISCKLFTCKYLKRKNIIFNSHNILLLDCFFNKKQHLILESNFFKTREEIIQKLLEKNNSPYFWYYLKRKYMI